MMTVGWMMDREIILQLRGKKVPELAQRETEIRLNWVGSGIWFWEGEEVYKKKRKIQQAASGR